MRYCESCGVSEIFSELKHIPPAFLLSHPMDNHSTPPRVLCVDERGCVRRSRMKMRPGAGIIWGGESIRHHLIHCCGERYSFGPHDKEIRIACTGIEEEWKFLEDDPFPEHRYVCNRCGKVQIIAKWKEYKNGLDRR